MSQIPELSRTMVRARDQIRCFRCGAYAPNGQWHHRRRRNVRDQHQHSPSNGIWLCAAGSNTCHEWVHSHPLEARIHGYIVSAFSKNPGEVPVLRWDGWKLLTGDGKAIPTTENGAVSEA